VKYRGLLAACVGTLLLTGCAHQEPFTPKLTIPKLQMPKNKLPFDAIEDYASYRVVATHYRTDKSELRYIMANDIAFKAFVEGSKNFPDGSKVVKIGWNTQQMPSFPAALEAVEVQRVEYMVKDKTQFAKDGGWGYARFVKQNGNYKSWDKGTEGCVSCHTAVKDNDYLFTRFQHLM